MNIQAILTILMVEDPITLTWHKSASISRIPVSLDGFKKYLKLKTKTVTWIFKFFKFFHPDFLTSPV